MGIPERSALLCGTLVCGECGRKLKGVVVMGKRGKREVVEYVVYVCRECRYRIKSYEMVKGMVEGLKEGE